MNKEEKRIIVDAYKSKINDCMALCLNYAIESDIEEKNKKLERMMDKLRDLEYKLTQEELDIENIERVLNKINEYLRNWG